MCLCSTRFGIGLAKTTLHVYLLPHPPRPKKKEELLCPQQQPLLFGEHLGVTWDKSSWAQGAPDMTRSRLQPFRRLCGRFCKMQPRPWRSERPIPNPRNLTFRLLGNHVHWPPKAASVCLVGNHVCFLDPRRSCPGPTGQLSHCLKEAFGGFAVNGK